MDRLEGVPTINVSQSVSQSVNSYLQQRHTNFAAYQLQYDMIDQSSQNHEKSNMSFRLAALSVVLQLSLSLSTLTERCKLPCKREGDRGTSGLLQPTLLLFCQTGCFRHTSRVRLRLKLSVFHNHNEVAKST